MNLRSYLRLLRPLHSGFGIVVFTASMVAGCKVLFDCDEPTAVLLSVVFVMPFLAGLAVAGAAHAAMHRPFFLLLPDGRRRLRRATFITLALTIPVVAGLVHLLLVPLPAAFGLALALTTLPLTNPRRWVGPRGGSWLLTVALGFLLLRLIGAGRVVTAVQEFPWIILAGGGAAAFWALRRSFTAADASDRAHTPYNSVGGIAVFHGMFNHSAHRRFLHEASQQHARVVPDRVPAGRPWTVRQVGPDSASWARVFQHAAIGRRAGSLLRAQLPIVAVLALYLMGWLLLNLVMSPGNQDLHHFLSNYWNTLAQLGRADLDTGRPSAVALAPILQLLFCAMLCLSVIRPQLAYPISRERLARVVFRQSLVQLVFALVLPACTILLLSLLGQVASGHFLPGLGLPPLLALDLGVLPLLPLLACAGTARRSASRVLLGAMIAVSLIITAMVSSLAASSVLTPAGLAVIALVTTATLLLLRWRLRQYYHTCDLTDLGRGSQLFGLPVSPAPVTATRC